MRLECVAMTRVATRALLLSIGISVALSRPGGAGQQPVTERPARPWTQARTAWGDPDLDGVWTSDNNFSVPLERPADVAGQSDVRRRGSRGRAGAPARRMIAAMADGGAVGAGPSHWYENLTAQSRRSSLIIDPPEGRLPALTAEAQRRAAQAAWPRPAGVPRIPGKIAASGTAASRSGCRA